MTRPCGEDTFNITCILVMLKFPSFSLKIVFELHKLINLGMVRECLRNGRVNSSRFYLCPSFTQGHREFY